MSRILACLLVLAFLLVLAAADDHIVLKPLKNVSSLPTKLLIFIPGGNVPNAHYVNTSLAIQRSTKMNLWIVIPSVTNKLCIIECSGKDSVLCAPLRSSVGVATKKAESMGFAGDASPFIAGHSLGGTCTNYLVQAFQAQDDYSAAVVMGGYVDETGSGSLSNYAVPVLTLGAELDGGMAKPSRMSLWYKQYKAFEAQAGLSAALTKKPVVILSKIDHSNFCPGFQVPGDRPSEIPNPIASALIGDAIASFLHLQPISQQPASVVQASMTNLKQHADSTSKLLAPILAALDLEAQMLMAGLKGEQALNASEAQTSLLRVVDTYYNKSSDPPPCLEHCHNNFSRSASQLTVTTCSHNDYETDLQNTGANAAAHEVACKMWSREKVAELQNQSRRYGAEPQNACRLINGEAIKMALHLVESLGNADTMTRYKAKGRSICLEPDFHATGNIGPLWVQEKLKLIENKSCLSVSSLSEYSPLSSKIYPGVHYCKLLSPARVVEWIMTDSFSDRY